jgi:hypothetical protein
MQDGRDEAVARASCSAAASRITRRASTAVRRRRGATPVATGRPFPLRLSDGFAPLRLGVRARGFMSIFVVMMRD